MENVFDFCIIGGGISGLYFAKRLYECFPNISCLLLEKNDYFGGRAQTYVFEGVKIVQGPAVARIGKDNLLMNLSNDLNIKTPIHDSHMTYSSKFGLSDVDAIKKIKNYIHILSSSVNLKTIKSGETFEQYGQRILGKSDYDLFSSLIGYTDYENANIIDTLNDYGFDDNYTDPTDKISKIGAIKWDVLVKKLVKMFILHFGKDKIIKNANVNQINKDTNNYQVKFYYDKNENKTIQCKNIIIATTSESCKKLFPNALWHSDLSLQPFLRLYAKIDKERSVLFREKINTYTIVPNILQKIIPIDKHKGIYMIAYSDNKNATLLYEKGFGTIKENNKHIKKQAENLVEDALDLPKNSIKIDRLKGFFWKNGTHYYHPFIDSYCLGKNGISCRKKRLMSSLNPSIGLYVLGEGFSRNQGWTEGALQRVENVINEIVKKKKGKKGKK